MSSLRSKIAAVPLARETYHGLVKSVRRCGVPAMWRSLSGRRHVILTFHRVRPAGQPADPFDTCPSIGVEAFREILDHVRGRFTVVSLRELSDRRAGKDPVAAVTFDDGWRDNYDLAFPVLRELGIPATIFVTTGKIGGSEPFWQQALGRMFRVAGACPEGEASRDLRAVLGLRNGRPLTPELYRNTVARWKRLKQAECLDLLLRAGWTSPSVSNGSRRFLSADEIREMAAAGIAFGSHTVTHAILPQLSSSEIERELSESKAALESLLGDRIDALAYPDGKYSDEVLQRARAAGYRVGCTTQSRWIAGGNGPLSMPRIDVGYDYSPKQNVFA